MPSEIIAAFLWAQLENLDDIQTKRLEHWNNYHEGLKDWTENNRILLPGIPKFATNNAHMFYLVCSDLNQRNKLINKLKSKGILAVFHYLSLHKSPFYLDKHGGRNLVNADCYTDCVVRLPFFYELEKDTINFIKNELYEAVKNI